MYDLAIIGAGPAGLSASVYASRYGIKNIVIGQTGGLAIKAHEISNWLGTQKIAGFEFVQKAEEHVLSYGVKIEPTIISEIKGKKNNFILTLDGGKELQAKNILIAMGTIPRQLGVSGEKELLGKGVSYCVTCDGFLYKGKIVVIVGGNNSAIGGAIFMSDIAEKIYIIYRGEKLRAENSLSDSVLNNKKIEVIYNTNIKGLKGEEKWEEIIVENEYQKTNVLKSDGLFIEIGSVTATDLVKKLSVELDEEGFIKINAEGKTNVEGIWAAGDITTGSNKLRQIVTAVAEGAIAINSIKKDLKARSI